MRFGEVYSQNRRKVVIHHILNDNILQKLKPNDLVFFDDCLFSQYQFLKTYKKELESLGIVSVIGLSPKAIRPDGNIGISAIESHVLHDQMNKEIVHFEDNITGDYLNGFMSKNEIDDLLNYNDIFLALHGCCHLKLENETNIFKRLQLFIDDLNSGVKQLKNLGYSTDIFVYPYAYEPSIGASALQKHGFRYIFAGKTTKRIPVEAI